MGFLTTVFFVTIFVSFGEVSSQNCYQYYSVKEYYQCSYSVRESYAHSYTTNCGILWLFRCTKYRVEYRYNRAYQVCTKYVEQRQCCQGWSGPSCNIHDQKPIVEYCPRNTEVTATGRGDTHVRWDRPRFREPHGFDLTITSTHNGESAHLSWGSHTVRYTARSNNNNKEVQCQFSIKVKPPLPVPKIQGHNDGEVIEVKEGQQMTFHCFSEYGDPPMGLEWYIDNTQIVNGSRFHVEDSDHPPYKNSFNRLIFTLHRSHGTLECRGQQVYHSLMRKITLYFNVDYDLPPAVHHCPPDQEIITEEDHVFTRWSKPIFYDHKNETLTISCNLPELNETHPDYRFTWGDNDVVYTARNPRSGLESKCEFVIQVKTKRCQPLSTPVGGALVCGTWSYGNTQICIYMCENRYDILLTNYVPQFFVCSSSGVWLPSPESISCSRQRLPNRDNMPSLKHYYSGDCDLSQVKDNMKNATIDIIQNSIVNDICKFDTCSLDHLVVNC